jgi:uncharacterized protein (TIGR03437 family)
MPLRFEANAGQTDPQIHFCARTAGGSVWLHAQGAILKPLGVGAVRVDLAGPIAPSAPEPLEPLASRSHYYLGRDPAQWRRDVPEFARVRYRHVWPGIDLVYYGNGEHLEYDFRVEAGADPNAILLVIHADAPVRLTGQGDLLLAPGVRQHKPRIYQQTSAGRRAVSGRYVLAAGNRVRFRIGRYDRSLPLIIDPVISYSTLFGGDGNDAAAAIAADGAGNVYITGRTESSDLPAGIPGSRFAGAPPDIFVAKLTPDGTGVVYCTYIGGEGADEAHAIAVDSAGNAFITGSTASTAFPATGGAFKSTYSGGKTDAFVAKLAPDGALLYATYFGGAGDDEGRGIAADTDGNAYITGATTSALIFPLTLAPFQSHYEGGAHDGFAAKLNALGTAVIYSTLLGSSGDDQPAAITVDTAGSAFITGSTGGDDYPTTTGAFQGSAPNQVSMAFVTKINSVGMPAYSTYLGGDIADYGKGIAVDAAGNVFIAGVTSSDNFPVTQGGFQVALSGPSDAFIAKLNAAGSALIYATLLGGTGDDDATAIALDLVGNVYVTGNTTSRDFPVAAGSLQDAPGGGTDAFIAKLDPTAAKLVYSSYLGGSQDERATAIAVDPVSNVYVTGSTASRDFKTTAGAMRVSPAAADSFVAKVRDVVLPLLSVDNPSLSFSYDTLLTRPAARTLQVSANNGAVKFTVETIGGSWLEVSPSGATTPGSLSVLVNPDRLSVGNYTGSIVLTAPGVANSPLTVPVSFAISRGALSPPAYGITPDTLPAGSGNTTVAIFGTGFSVNATVKVNGVAVQTVWIDSFTLNAIIPSELLAIPGALTITVANPTALTAPLMLNVVAVVPTVIASGVVNAASFLSGPVAAGEVVIIHGKNIGPADQVQDFGNGETYPTVLAGTRVFFDDVAAPLLYTSATQIIAVVPFEITGPGNTRMRVEFNRQPSDPVTLEVGPAAPGLFTQTATGAGQLAASNEDGLQNSADNPAAPGSLVTFQATGGGQTSPRGVDGAILSEPVPHLLLPVTVEMGDQECEIVSAGPMPGIVSGFLQITARVPEGLSGRVPVVMQVGGIPSQPGVTLEVRAVEP